MEFESQVKNTGGFALGLARLYKAEKLRLRALANRFIGNPTAAEDVVQQAFVNILKTQGVSFDQSAYTSQAVRNLALNYLHDNRRRAVVELQGIETENIADQQPSPEIVALHRSELQRLLTAISALPQKRREAFIACKIEGLTYEEVAIRQGISRNTVISQVITALIQLDAALQADKP